VGAGSSERHPEVSMAPVSGALRGLAAALALLLLGGTGLVALRQRQRLRAPATGRAAPDSGEQPTDPAPRHVADAPPNQAHSPQR